MINELFSAIVAFLAFMNPFALFLYLSPVMKELNRKRFASVLLRASLISFGVYLFFLLSGEWLFAHIFQINFESFRIFGGVVVFSLAYLYIIKGKGAIIHVKENLDDLASEIALPFMVGAGSISLSILLGSNFSKSLGVTALIIIMASIYAIILSLQWLRDSIKKKKFRVAFDKSMSILLRLNAFFMGAIGIDMVITGIKNLRFI